MTFFLFILLAILGIGAYRMLREMFGHGDISESELNIYIVCFVITWVLVTVLGGSK